MNRCRIEKSSREAAGKTGRGAGWRRLPGAALCLCLAAGPLAAAGSEDASAVGVKETVDINVQAQCPSIPGLPKDTKAVTGFTHGAHAAKYLPGKSALSSIPYEDSFTCGACHPGAAGPEAIGAESACDRLARALAAAGGGEKLKDYFHDSCLSCHKALKKAGDTAVPVRCNECHGK